MKTPFILTIGRQFGSGGRDLGQKLARMLSIDYYDKELLYEASRESGLSAEYFEKADEKAPSSLMHALPLSFLMGGGSYFTPSSLSNENIFKFQADVINHIAGKKSCIIVGRCADYILRQHPCCFNIFIHAPKEFRIARITENEHLTAHEAAELIEKKDKSRASYYNFYTDKTWGSAASYHFCIDSSLLGIEGTATFIRDLIREKWPDTLSEQKI